MVQRTLNPEDVLLFCPRCFASSEGGSWTKGEAIVGDDKHSLCSNCGANDCAVKIPRWAVKSIREQASWVGKRYYPADEDYERGAEVESLRMTIRHFHGRSVRRTEDGEAWWVTQETPGGRSTSITSEAKTEEEALEEARTHLPYVAPLTVKPSRNGRGAFATIGFKKGDLISDWTDSPRSKQKDLPVPYAEDRYAQVAPDLYLGWTGEPGDYANHSCEPNAELVVELPVVRLVALRDIKEGEEVTYDYTRTMFGDEWEIPCNCGSSSCRKTIKAYKPESKKTTRRIVKP